MKNEKDYLYFNIIIITKTFNKIMSLLLIYIFKRFMTGESTKLIPSLEMIKLNLLLLRYSTTLKLHSLFGV